MGSIFYIMGKSSTGKDTIFKKLKQEMPELKTIVLYTTRPIREGEENGVEYYFVGEETLQALEHAGKVIELREYETVHGVWKYFTVNDGQIDLQKENYLVIGTLTSYEKMCSYFGRDSIVPIYIEVEDKERLLRAIGRESQQKEPKYAELCRRFLSDSSDFVKEELHRLRIENRFDNQEAEACVKEILLFIRKRL